MYKLPLPITIGHGYHAIITRVGPVGSNSTPMNICTSFGRASGVMRPADRDVTNGHDRITVRTPIRTHV